MDLASTRVQHDSSLLRGATHAAMEPETVCHNQDRASACDDSAPSLQSPTSGVALVQRLVTEILPVTTTDRAGDSLEPSSKWSAGQTRIVAMLLSDDACRLGRSSIWPVMPIAVFDLIEYLAMEVSAKTAASRIRTLDYRQ